MYRGQVIFLLVLPAVVAVTEGIKITFPLLSPQISDCINSECVVKIDECTEHHGTHLTSKLRGCIAKKCKRAMSTCTEWIIQTVLSVQLKKSSSPPVLLTAMAYNMKTEGINSYLHCWKNSDLQRSSQLFGCLIDSLTEKVQPYITEEVLQPLFRDPDYVSCWIFQALRKAASCYDYVGEEYFASIGRNAAHVITTNHLEYVHCFMNITSWNDRCQEIFTQIYGSTPSDRTKSKDLMVCFIDRIISASAACN